MVTCSACQKPATATCATCRASLCEDHTQPGHPLITARQLVTTTATTAFRAPGLLSDILFKEMDQVAYCAACREAVAARRTTEQLKFLLGMLLIFAVAVGIPLYLMFLR
jgi:hypothetical protein